VALREGAHPNVHDLEAGVSAVLGLGVFEVASDLGGQKRLKCPTKTFNPSSFD